ncbi:hypothetical protein [Methylosinus sp. KRF6]|uniref:hypothetical protein n=1 Tax=Methylosinus sp. KRF6 TaxID=2846853 RepID=UPI001C0BBFCD|nr:hypothetical protein [Methylosinus sp. KRF6]MBU3890096.1 hypothetical protein [Methylosinus sp. KRF6]
MQQLLARGDKDSPFTKFYVDDSTGRLVVDPHAGAPGLYVGQTGVSDAALLAALTADRATGRVSFPNGAEFPNGLLLPSVGMHNRIINGNFEIWQRGYNFTAVPGGVYTADRWICYPGGGLGSVSANKAAPTSGFTGSTVFSAQGNGAPVGGQIHLVQRFEGQTMADIAGHDAMLSFDISASSSAGSISGVVYAHTNSALDNGTYANLCTYTPFDIPAGVSRIEIPIAGAAIQNFGLGGQIGILITQNSAPGNISLTIGAVQFERGPVANPFEYRHSAIEWALCERYFQRITGWGGGWQWGAEQLAVAGSFRTIMAHTPTVIIIDGTLGAEQFGWSFQNILSIHGASMTPEGGIISFITTACNQGSLGGISYVSKIYASAEL